MPGDVSVHARHPSHRLSRQAVDDAPVRRLRQRARHERAVQVPARARPDGAVHGVRLPDADGLRLGPSALGGRSRQDGRRDLEPRRHGSAVRRHPARQGLDVDDDQRAGDHPLGVLHRRRREAGRLVGQAARHDSERHPERVHGAARVVLPDRARAASHRRLLRVGRASTRRTGTRSRSPATTFARRGRPRRRSSRSRSPTASRTSSAASRADSTSTTSRRACRSSGTSTTISSRRSPSCARRVASGRAT